MTTSLVTLAEIKDFIKTAPSFTENDALYKSLAVKSTKLLEQFTRRNFEKTQYTEFFGTRKAGKVALDLYGSTLTGYASMNEVQKFYLKNTPVDMSSAFHVYFDLNRVWGADSELTDDIYWVDAGAGILSISTNVGKTDNTVKVVYTAGYNSVTADSWTTLSDAAPEDLKLACLATVSSLFGRTKDRMFGMRQYGSTDNDADFSHYGMIPPEAREIILPYRKTYVGRQ